MLHKADSGKSFPLAVAIILVAFIIFYPSSTSIFEQLFGIKVTFEEGIEIIRSKGYPINKNFKWYEITAAGVKITETSWKGFLQICERIKGDFGNLQVYVDLEARVMWVWADPTANESEREAYYVKFI